MLAADAGTGQDLKVRESTTCNLPGSKGVGRLGGFGGTGLILAFPNNASNSDGFFEPKLSTTAAGQTALLTAPPVFASGLGLMALRGWRGKQNAAAIAA
jgi:hypothetical protein